MVLESGQGWKQAGRSEARAGEPPEGRAAGPGQPLRQRQTQTYTVGCSGCSEELPCLRAQDWERSRLGKPALGEALC